MNLKSTSLPAPSLEECRRFFASLLRQFNSRRVVYLDKKGCWAENPLTLRDRISHHLLFTLWKEGESISLDGLERGLLFLVEQPTWLLVQRISQFRSEDSPLFILFETLVWILERWSVRLNADAHVPTWNTRAMLLREYFRLKLANLDRSLETSLSKNEKRQFLQAVLEVERASSGLFEPIAQLSAEEEKITLTIESLLEEAEQDGNKDEAYGAVIERIQPPMGIVTELSSALFLPSLRLLLDPQADVESGIPYMASLVLSIFNDPRSSGALIEALERYPLSCTKIRENLIYTLGNLREGEAVRTIVRVLNEPDEVIAADRPSEKKACLLLEQKEEAIWALGKIGFPAVSALPTLIHYSDHPSARLKTYLAWALGEIGLAQKEKSGGVSADLVIALLRLLKEKNKQVFEEAASALKKIRMPEFLHSLYLYSTGAISILGLKPAQRGLNELSETIHYLLKTKKRVVVAVNGDSGTGKTYFCQAIARGFGGLRASQILYLMRDSKRGQKVFNRLLGMAWLKDHIDPTYYQDYPLSAAEDNPEAFFHEFLKENADKRLILLDGCRDRDYFQKVIDIFYQNEELDVEVNFRANFSTRRLNLEERERTVESVKLHLAFLEEPALEDTSFYQEGLVVLYDLDNSLDARLNEQETRELFEESRIDSWGEFIRIGDFSGETTPGGCRTEDLSVNEAKFTWRERVWPESRVTPFTPEEEILKPYLNESLEAEPSLLMTISVEDLEPERLRFYALEQFSGNGKRGSLFVLTLLDNRLFKTRIEDSIVDLALVGRNFFVRTEQGHLLNVSFEKNEITEFLLSSQRPLAIAALPPNCLVAAAEEGSVCLWDLAERKIICLSAELSPAIAVAADARGKIYTWNRDGLWRWDFPKKRLHHVVGLDASIGLIRPYLKGKILAVEKTDGTQKNPRLFIVDFEKKSSLEIFTPFGVPINNVNFCPDGRILVGLAPREGLGNGRGKTLAILTPGQEACTVANLSGHGKETHDCLPMGPRIITCGKELDGSSTIRLWGSPSYVRTELGKLRIKAP